MYNKPRFDSIRTEVLRDQTSTLQHPDDGLPNKSLHGIQIPSGIHQRDQYVSPQASLRRTNIEQNVTTNSVDSLNIYSYFDLEGTKDAAGITMSRMVQQALQRIQIPFFDGSPSIWVEFIVKFRYLVHQQKHLTNIQRIT